jgi:pantoate--beta-alanine ligase
MIVISDKCEMRLWSRNKTSQGLLVGLVPTMGFLHKGHVSLISLARQNTDVLVVSIYVNPTQFSANEDFHLYPSSLEQDKKCALCPSDVPASVL